MKTTNFPEYLSVGLCVLGAACASKNGVDEAPSNQPGYNAAAGGNAAITGFDGGLLAQNTANGLQQISSVTATALKDPAKACNGTSAEPEGGTPPILEFVIDVTGSMVMDPANPSDPNGPKKWDVFSATMPGVFQALPSNFAVGVSYFRKPDTACFQPDQAVPIGILDSNQLALVDGSLQNRTVQGATPTYAAWKFALDTLQAWQPPTGYATSPRYIVLITDGVPTVNADGCTYVNPITQTEYDSEIQLIKTEGLAAGVKTFVVGVVGSENPQNATYDPLYMLSQIAIAGGTEQPPGCVPQSGRPAGNTVNPRGSYCHFDLSQATNFGQALTSALGAIAGSVLPCTYSVPSTAGQTIDPSKTNLIYTDNSTQTSYVVLPNTSGNCDRGWHFTDSTNTKIEICSITCQELQSNSTASLELSFGCTQGQIINRFGGPK